MTKAERIDKIRGCLIGGAAGDALGYTVEFMGEDEIKSEYGESGIGKYESSMYTAKGNFSDDTQMTLFTAAGLLSANIHNNMNNTEKPFRYFVRDSYYDWLETQTMPFANRRFERRAHSWLFDVEGLYARRAPGNACIMSTRARFEACEADGGDYLANPINDSKGCGGVMRAAPVGLLEGDIEKLDMESARIAAITHGHQLGYMPAMLLTHIVNRLVYPVGDMTLKEIVKEAVDFMGRMFEGCRHLRYMRILMEKAMELAENDDDDILNIHRLGEGWVGEEAIAIAVYCALRHEHNFSAAIIAAVNHRGDSDSTGAIVGNILGAKFGYAAIDDKWKNDLELSDVILEIADDMAKAYSDEPAFIEKYAPYIGSR